MNKTQYQIESILNIDPKMCVGCGACVQVCTKKCITMVKNEEGFLFPKIKLSDCVSCSRCTKVCQIIHRVDLIYPKDTYCAISKEDKIWKMAASGGISSQLAKWLIEEYDGMVVGCIIDKNHYVKHISIDNLSDIEKIAGSKYVQSDIDESLVNIKEALKKGRKCIFLGTPCQVAGLKLYLDEHMVNQKNLFTVDNVCHGVPSPVFWEKCVKYYGDKNIEKIRFRKKIGMPRRRSAFRLNITYSKSKQFNYPVKCDAFYNLFMNCMTFRESCYQCPYAAVERCADITVGDCDSAYLYRNLKGYKAKSIVLINTEKGKDIWNNISGKFDFTRLDLKEEIKVNHQLEYPSIRPKKRDDIYIDILKSSYEDLNKKYANSFTLVQRLSLLLEDILPVKLYKLIVRVIRWGV